MIWFNCETLLERSPSRMKDVHSRERKMNNKQPSSWIAAEKKMFYDNQIIQDYRNQMNV